jgi:serine/threonine-protein kinase RsbW
MKFIASFENLYLMLDCVETESKNRGFSENEADKIRLALEEVLTNIIYYAYDNQKGHIEIHCDHPLDHHKGIVFVIHDQGKPFNPLQYSDEIHSIDLVGGYGIIIYTGIMDNSSYDRIGNSNILMLTKYL